MEKTKFKIGDSVIIKEEVCVGLDFVEYIGKKAVIVESNTEINLEYPFTIYFEFNTQKVTVKEEWLEKFEDKDFWKENNYIQEELTFGQKLYNVLDDISTLLENKNKKYGDAALNPKRIFSKLNSLEQLKVRIDDKLSRIANQNVEDDEDVVGDLIGYLIIYKIALNDKTDRS
jgi:hypothetical protein